MPSVKKIEVGLDIGNFSVKVVKLSEKKFSPKKVLSFGIENISETATNQQIADTIKKAIETAKVTTSQVNISVSGPNITYRIIRMPLMNRSELKKVLELGLDKYIPFKGSEVLWECRILEVITVPAVGKQMSVLLVAAKREFIEERINMVRNAGLEPQLIDVDVFAMMNAFNFVHRHEDKKVTALLNIGSYFSNLVILKKGVPHFARDLLLGGRDITQTIAERLHLALSTAETMKYNIGEEDKDILKLIKVVLENLCNELIISFEYIKKEIGDNVETIYVSGGSIYLYDMVKFLNSRLGIRVKQWDFNRAFELETKLPPQKLETIFPSLAVAIGLALE